MIAEQGQSNVIIVHCVALSHTWEISSHGINKTHPGLSSQGHSTVFQAICFSKEVIDLKQLCPSSFPENSVMRPIPKYPYVLFSLRRAAILALCRYVCQILALIQFKDN